MSLRDWCSTGNFHGDFSSLHNCLELAYKHWEMGSITDRFKLYWHRHSARKIDTDYFNFLWKQLRKTFTYYFTCQKIREDFIKCWISASLGI